MWKKRLNIFERVISLDKGLGITAKIVRDPVDPITSIEFKPQENPLFTFHYNNFYKNEVVFKKISRNLVIVFYLEVVTLDKRGEIPSVRAQAEEISYSKFLRIIKMFGIPLRRL